MKFAGQGGHFRPTNKFANFNLLVLRCGWTDLRQIWTVSCPSRCQPEGCVWTNSVDRAPSYSRIRKPGQKFSKICAAKILRFFRYNAKTFWLSEKFFTSLKRSDNSASDRWVSEKSLPGFFVTCPESLARQGGHLQLNQQTFHDFGHRLALSPMCFISDESSRPPASNGLTC